MTIEQRIQTIAFTGDDITVRFSEGREVTLPVSYFPRLQAATISQREQWSLIGRGLGVHWESVDEDLSVENILLAYSRHRKESYAQATRFSVIPEQHEDAVTTEELQQFKELLNNFGHVPESKETSHKTFFEICGVSSRELPYSSFLAYFLNPKNKEHGFGDLFLRSLVQASGKTLNTDDLRSVKIEREVRTNKGNFIDLLIEGHSFLIGIENKIRADLYNDLQDYFQHLEGLASQANPKKAVLALVLSIKEEKPRDGFVPVLYRAFIAEIQKNLGETLPHADHRSITYLLDFITSIHHLEKGTRMDKALLKFFQGNEQATIKFYRKTLELTEMMREKVKKVFNRIKWVEFPSSPFTKPDFYASIKDEVEIYDVVYCDVDISAGLTCAVEAGFYLNAGWLVTAAPRDQERFVELGTWLEDSGIKSIKEKSIGSWKQWVYAEFPFEENEEIVAERYKELLSKIADKLNIKETC